jgi:hypothetical protein
MLSSTHATGMPQGMLAGGSLHSPETGADRIEAFGPVEDEDHILVLGGQGSELMCALIRAGATNVTHLRAFERPEADSASLVIVPWVASLDWLATALPSIRRALSAQGRIVLLAGSQAKTVAQIRRMLTLHGLSAIHTQSTEDGQVVSAERPRRQFAGPTRRSA